MCVQEKPESITKQWRDRREIISSGENTDWSGRGEDAKRSKVLSVPSEFDRSLEVEKSLGGTLP